MLAIAALGVLGSGVESRLTPTSLSVPGTPAAEGAGLLEAHFGESAPFAVLLRGPATAIERQGPALVRALRRDPRVTTLSPWDGKALARLRPSAGRALILVDFHTSLARAVDDVVPRLDSVLERVVRPPVQARETGFASLSRAIQDESIDSTERAELLALPFLLLVLLVVFRSPIAALIPLAFGAVTVIAARGLLYLASSAVSIDAFSLTVATMMGLALGVDYALLMVSRFREELGNGAEPLEAAWSTRRTAGRTTLFAGSTLFASMIVTIFVLPGSLLLSLAGTAIAVTALSVVVANYLTPPLLLLLGHNVDRWRLGRSGGGEHTLLRRSLRAALRRPAPIAVAISGALLLLATPALAIKTGPPSAAQLPSSDPARRASELISRQMGAGWEAPFVLVAATEAGPITTTADLRHLARFQSLLARQPEVQEVIGPSQEVAKRTAPLRKQGGELLGPRGNERLAGLRHLGPKLGKAGSGVGRLRAGVSEAAAGAGLLRQGSSRAHSGAAQLSSGLAKAASGGDRAIDALGRLASGAGRLAEGQETAKAGALSLALGLHDLLPQLRRGSLARARRIRERLDALLAADPALKPAVTEAGALVVALAAQRNELRSLRATAFRLHGGSTRLAAGQRRVASATHRLAGAAGSLGSGLHRLAAGAGALSGGLARLSGGTEALASGLADGYTRSAPLQSGLQEAAVKVSAQSARITRQRRALVHASPHLFDSGYFVLSALDGARPGRREQVAQSIDLDSGQAAAMIVVPDQPLNSPASEALDHRLNHLAASFGAKAGLRTGVTGGPAQLTDYNRITTTRVPLVILAMTAVTFLALVVILQAVIVAAIAVVLNLMTVGVAFGVLALLFHVPAGYPLGGHDYVDAIGAAAIFGIVFGLSVDYAVFLLARMRESYEASGDHRLAVTDGLERTAGVITGAAAIMMAVFVTFAAAKIATVSQLGVGLAVAVALDATVVRILLLPALMLLIGKRVWWLPRPLRRVLPRIDLHPT